MFLRVFDNSKNCNMSFFYTNNIVFVYKKDQKDDMD